MTTKSPQESPPSNPESSHQQQPPLIPYIPPPWSAKGDIFLFPFWTSNQPTTSSPTPLLPTQAYSPLEASSDFACPSSSGTFVGGLGTVQITRYHDSPVGPYDEMILVPGSFAWKCFDLEALRVKRGVNPRITRMYVSQRETCYNGRTSTKTKILVPITKHANLKYLDWNYPQHLATFNWTTNTDTSTTIEIYPHDTRHSSSESTPSSIPFFKTTFHPIKYTPRFTCYRKQHNGHTHALVSVQQLASSCRLCLKTPVHRADNYPARRAGARLTQCRYARMLAWAGLTCCKVKSAKVKRSTFGRNGGGGGLGIFH